MLKTIAPIPSNNRVLDNLKAFRQSKSGLTGIREDLFVVVEELPEFPGGARCYESMDH